jgi:hypothetical protein
LQPRVETTDSVPPLWLSRMCVHFAEAVDRSPPSRLWNASAVAGSTKAERLPEGRLT